LILFSSSFSLYFEILTTFIFSGQYSVFFLYSVFGMCLFSTFCSFYFYLLFLFCSSFYFHHSFLLYTFYLTNNLLFWFILLSIRFTLIIPFIAFFTISTIFEKTNFNSVLVCARPDTDSQQC
jgi:hypothetical protein